MRKNWLQRLAQSSKKEVRRKSPTELFLSDFNNGHCDDIKSIYDNVISVSAPYGDIIASVHREYVSLRRGVYISKLMFFMFLFVSFVSFLYGTFANDLRLSIVSAGFLLGSTVFRLITPDYNDKAITYYAELVQMLMLDKLKVAIAASNQDQEFCEKNSEYIESALDFAKTEMATLMGITLNKEK